MGPIQPRWQLVTPPENLAYAVNSALFNRLPNKVSLQAKREVMTQHGLHGQPFVTPSTKIHGSTTLKTLSHSYKFLLTDTEWAHWLPQALLLKLEQWMQPFMPWGRCLPHWDIQTPDYNAQGISTSDSTNSCNITTNQTRHLQESNLFHYRSSNLPSGTVSRAPWQNHMPLARC
jgi:hypothetical protein